MRRTFFSVLQGETSLNVIQRAVAAAFTELAGLLVGNLAESGGVWTISQPVDAPRGKPPAGCYFAWIDRSDGKLYTRGPAGTDTVIGSP